MGSRLSSLLGVQEEQGVHGSSRGSSGKDELQGRLDVPPGGLQGPQAQLIVLDAHVP